MDTTVGMLPVIESPNKKAKMEGRHKADFSESKFVKYYKAGQTGSISEEDSIHCGAGGGSCQSRTNETQSTTMMNSSSDNLEYSPQTSQSSSPLNYPVDVQCAAAYGTSLNSENKENLQTETSG